MAAVDVLNISGGTDENCDETASDDDYLAREICRTPDSNRNVFRFPFDALFIWTVLCSVHHTFLCGAVE
jgi:hypothetical protein